MFTVPTSMSAPSAIAHASSVDIALRMPGSRRGLLLARRTTCQWSKHKSEKETGDMRRATFVIAAALAAGISATATAQTPARSAANHATTPAGGPHGTEGHWLASGFAGANFGDNFSDDLGEGDTSFTFGGQIGYLWHGWAGAEGLVDFSPSFKVPNNLLLSDNPHLSSYMANGIAAVPMGAYGQFLPYFSGGIGIFHMGTDFLTLDPATSLTGSRNRFGVNLGGGFIGYAGNVGVRGDVRFYNVDTDHDIAADSATDLFTLRLLSGLEYWRASVGVAFRW